MCATSAHGDRNVDRGGRPAPDVERDALGGAPPPRAAHSWFVQLGECSRERGILGGLRPYTPLTANEQGTIAASVALPFTVPTEGQYAVTVLQSELVNSSSVACGNLTKDRAAPATIAGMSAVTR
jgi:hypothetical protein